MICCKKGNREMVELLIQSLADLQATDNVRAVLGVVLSSHCPVLLIHSMDDCVCTWMRWSETYHS